MYSLYVYSRILPGREQGAGLIWVKYAIERDIDTQECRSIDGNEYSIRSIGVPFIGQIRCYISCVTGSLPTVLSY